MTTRITTKPKRCLKGEFYIYLPTKRKTKELRYYACNTPGRIALFDEFGRVIKTKQGKDLFGFDNLGTMLQLIEKTKKKLILKRTK